MVSNSNQTIRFSPTSPVADTPANETFASALGVTVPRALVPACPVSVKLALPVTVRDPTPVVPA